MLKTSSIVKTNVSPASMVRKKRAEYDSAGGKICASTMSKMKPKIMKKATVYWNGFESYRIRPWVYVDVDVCT